MKRNILSAAIISLLCVSNSSFAESVFSTVTINGVSHVYEFATEEDARLAATEPTAAQKGEYLTIFDTDSTQGLVTETTVDGKPVTLVRTSKNKTVVVEKDAEGVSQFTALTTDGTNESSLSKVVEAYLDGAPVEGSTTEAGKITTTDFTEVQKALNEVTTATISTQTIEDNNTAIATTAQVATTTAIADASVSADVEQAPVTTIVSLNGVEKSFSYDNITQAKAALNDPNELVQFSNAASSIGGAVRVVSGGVSQIYTQLDENTVIIAQETAKGVEYFTIAANDPTKLNAAVEGFLSGNSELVTAAEAIVVEGFREGTDDLAKAQENFANAEFTQNIASVKRIVDDIENATVAVADADGNFTTVDIVDLLAPSEVIALNAEVVALGAKLASLEAQLVAAEGDEKLAIQAEIDAATTDLATAKVTRLEEAVALNASADAFGDSEETKNDANIVLSAADALFGLDPLATDEEKAAAIAAFNAAQEAKIVDGAATKVTSEITLNGVTQTLIFANQDEADAFFQSDNLANLGILFRDSEGNFPASREGMVIVSSLNDGPSVTLVQLSGARMAVRKDDGEFVLIKVADVGNANLYASVQDYLLLSEKDVADLTEEEKLRLAAYQAEEFDAISIAAMDDAGFIVGIDAKAELAKVELAEVESLVGKEASRHVRHAVMMDNYDMAANYVAEIKTTQFQVKETASSQIAGNPASAMNTSIDAVFNQIANTSDSNMVNVASASSDSGVKTSLDVGLQYGYYDLDGTSVHSITMPIAISAQLSPKGKVIFSLPLSYFNTSGRSDSYQIGVNLGYQYSATKNWTLTPTFSYVYRSLDETKNILLDTMRDTHILGGSLTSQYTWDLSPSNAKGLKVTMTNMAGYFETSGMDGIQTATFAGTPGTANSSDISNYVLKNSIKVSKSVGNFKLSGYFTDNEYFGDDLYFEQYNEIGFSLKPENHGALNNLTVDANYLFSFDSGKSGDLDGFKLNLNYRY